MFATVKSNFNYFGHCCEYDVIIEIFTLLVEYFFKLFSSMNKLICLISENNHLITPLETFYGDL